MRTKSALAAILGEYFRFTEKAAELAPGEIRALLALDLPAADPKMPPHMDPRARLVFLQAALSAGLDDRALTKAWRAVLKSEHDLSSEHFSWGTPRRMKPLTRLAAEPSSLAAAQAVAVGCPVVSRNVLAVLAIDGSESSRDALLPHVHRAVTDGGRALDDVFAIDGFSAPSVKPLLAEALGRRGEEPAAAFLEAVMGAAVPALSVEATLSTLDGVREVIASLTIRSGLADWFKLELTLVSGQLRRHSRWNASQAIVDELGLGPLVPAELPQLLARVEKKLAVEWAPKPAWLKTNLKGGQRTRFVAWLMRR